MTGDSPDVHNDFDGETHAVVQAGAINQVNFGCVAHTKRLALTVTHGATIAVSPDGRGLVHAQVEAERARLIGLAEVFDWSQNPPYDPFTTTAPGESQPDRRRRHD